MTVPPPEREPVVRLRDVGRRYGNGTVALRDVSVTLRAGEHVAVVGRSGSGKSTLLNIVGLLDAPTSGEIVLEGAVLATGADRQRSRVRATRVGFVFQRAHLIPDLSVWQNVELGSAYSGATPAQARRAITDALTAVGLGHRAHAPARTLSGGEMQRAAIARTLVRPARLWLADEPTGNLDSAQSGEVIELLKRTASERGATLVVVTHEPDVAARLDRTITLHDGAVAADSRDPAGPDGDAVPEVPADAVPEVPADAAPTRRSRAADVRAAWRRNARFIVQAVTSQRSRVRTYLVASSLAVALTIAALGLAQSARSQVTDLFDAQRATEVTAAVVNRDGGAAPRWPISTANLAGFPGVHEVEYWRYHLGVPVANGTLAALDADVVEVDRTPGDATASVVRWAPGGDRELGEGEAIIGAVLAERLGIAQLSLGPEVTVAGARLRVAGLLEESRSGTAAGSVFVVAADADTLPPASTGAVAVRTAPGGARVVADRLAPLLDPYGQLELRLDPVLAPDAYRDQLESSVTVSLTILASICALAGLGVVIFVSLLGVSMRTAEFGVRRAFGAGRGEIVALVMGEGALLAFLGSVVGLALGFTAVMVVTAVAQWQPVFDLRLLAVPVLGSLVFGLVGGVPPAVAASRIEPAEAVRAG